MRYSDVLAHLCSRGELLLAGQIEPAIQGYLYPLPVYWDQGQMIIHTPHHARMIFGHLQRALVDRGVVMLRPRISAIDLPRAGRFRVFVDWQEIAFPAEATRVSQTIYYCREAEAGLKIEMVSYLRQSMPELNTQFEALALSA